MPILIPPPPPLQRNEEEAAAVYAEFVAEFEAPAAAGKTFVRGDGEGKYGTVASYNPPSPPPLTTHAYLHARYNLCTRT